MKRLLDILENNFVMVFMCVFVFILFTFGGSEKSTTHQPDKTINNTTDYCNSFETQSIREKCKYDFNIKGESK